MTGRGLAVLILSVTLWGWSRALGIDELSQVAVGLFVAYVGALIWTRLRNRGLVASRSFGNAKIERGQALVMEIRIRNTGWTHTPGIIVEEAAGAKASFRTEVSPLPPGEHLLKQMVTFDRRGRYVLDRISVTLLDPYRIARHRRNFDDPADVLVYPKVELLNTPNVAFASSRTEKARRAPAPVGEDFYGVRDFRSGDDPRRIHWPTSARLGTLMIREEEISGRDRITVLLDDRASAHTDDTFEWSVDAAASVVDLYLRLGLQVRLVRPGGSEISPARGTLQHERVMEELATASLRPAAEGRLLALTRRGQDDVLVLVLGEIGPAAVANLARVAGRYRELVVIFGPGLRSPSEYAGQLARTGARLVHAPAGQGLSQYWDASLGRSSWTGEQTKLETVT